MSAEADQSTDNPQTARQLARSLQDPAVWILDAHQPGTTAELMETHISRVILTGNSAFKIRKPVNPGFADFSTLAKRKFDCEEELRLNRRLSPHLYLGLVTITGTPEHPQINGDGPPIEYAVHMRRFPQEALLLHVCAEGRLQPHHIDQLAEELATFHRSIPPAPADSPLGTPASILATVRGNFEHLQPALQSVRQFLDSPASGSSHGLSLAQVEQTKGTIDELQQLTEETFQQLEPLFRLRREQGWIRECHGDLHLQNMLLEDDRVAIFDCVEFNEEFRWIDILSDVCFAVMDLVANDHPELGWRLLDRWVERTDSYSALPAARFYLVYRAMVRAKVAGIRLQNALEELAQGEQVELNADWEELARYVRLAREFTSVYLPALILTYGVSGSGKTTLTRPLVEQLPAFRIRSDVERKRMYGLQPEERPAPDLVAEIYSEETSLKIRDQLAQRATDVVQAGFPVIVDATFLGRDWRDQFRQLAEELKVPCLLIRFLASDDELRQRVAARTANGTDASDADLAVLESQLANRQLLEEDELPLVIDCDTTTPDAANRLVNDVRRQLEFRIAAAT